MKILLLTLTIAFMNISSVYEFKATAIDGKEIDFSIYADKPLLIVNVASKCGFTPQYADLEKLHSIHGDRLVILGFPANNFGAQEPGSNLQIAEFCQKNYGVSFQMFEKISVKGPDQHALYQWLKEQSGEEPSWNFCKYLVKPDGTVKFFASNVSPLDRQIIDAIN
ncbi:MAG TPA: glutathione peroxidase [Ohtaekwangia sp.]|nr:glutathione peroxidase [Ohtaekwangia sp.]